MKGVDRNGSVKQRSDGDVVSAACTSVEIQGTYTIIVGAVDVRSVGGIGVDFVPAGGIRGVAGSVGIKVFRIRKGGDIVAGGTECNGSPCAVCAICATNRSIFKLHSLTPYSDA